MFSNFLAEKNRLFRKNGQARRLFQSLFLSENIAFFIVFWFTRVTFPHKIRFPPNRKLFMSTVKRVRKVISSLELESVN